MIAQAYPRNDLAGIECLSFIILNSNSLVKTTNLLLLALKIMTMEANNTLLAEQKLFLITFFKV